MRIIHPKVEFIWMTPNPLETIELAGRTCYKSEPKDAAAFTRKILNLGHEAMIEHASMSYRVICDRGVSHEIVRHRLFSFAQESTRYCNYKDCVTFIFPTWTPSLEWFEFLESSERMYLDMLAKGHTPQEARSVLPNALKTEIVITGNFREWKHFFTLRCAKDAHPQMRQIAKLILADAKKKVEVVFEDCQVG